MLHLPSFFSSAQIFRRKNRNHNWLVESAANGPVCHRQGKPRQGLRGNSHLRPCRAGVPPDQAGTRLAIYPFVLRLLFVSSPIKNRRTNGELSNNYRRTNEEMTTLPAACKDDAVPYIHLGFTLLEILKSIHNVQIDPVEAGEEDAVQVAVAGTADEVLPPGNPVADLVVAGPVGVLAGQPHRLVPLP